MEIVDVMWLCTCTDKPIGIVKAYDEIESRYKYYIGQGNGADEEEDIQEIIDFGQKYYNLDFLKQF